ncbi:MAG: hypothetical protein ACRDTH_15685, partial [Pseudonocardiaceae bacterium]
MAQRPGSPRLRGRPYLIVCALAGVFLVVLAIVAVAFVAPFGGGGAGEAAPTPPVTATTTIPPAAVPADISVLPQSTTYTAIDGAPLDPGSPNPTDGTVVHPRREIVVYS